MGASGWPSSTTSVLIGSTSGVGRFSTTSVAPPVTAFPPVPAASAMIIGMEGETIRCWMGASGWPSSPSRLLLPLALATMPAEK
jgi:hypothetical protein